MQAPAPGAAFVRAPIPRRAIGERDVAIDIAFCGICHTDLHFVQDDFGGGLFPMVPGHEIAGVVSAVGRAVTRFAVGDRVGVGCFVDSCGACEHCVAGEEQFCAQGAVRTYNGRGYDGEPTYGGYSRSIVVTERFVVRIPDALALAVAAPLLCAGITTYTPFLRWGAAGKRVAVVGLGGLGHVAVQIGAALGADVTVLSRSPGKEREALRFGATGCYTTRDADTFRQLANRFDLILNTVAAPLELDPYLRLLRVDGTMVNLGAQREAERVHSMTLLARRRSLAGSNTGGMRDTQAMLDLCATRGVAPQVEVLDANALEDAYGRLARGDVRYRFVVDAATI